MNFLAHIFLSHDDEDLLLGNFMADFIKNKDIDQFPATVQRGIILHREIDTFTDAHIFVKQGSQRLRANQGKYAPVVIDLLYDHILAANWLKYHDTPLQIFSKKVYEVFERRIDVFPPRLKKIIPFMIADDFLSRYEQESGLLFALKSMDKRAKFPSKFEFALDQLNDERHLFDDEFHQFFPEVITLSRAFVS